MKTNDLIQLGALGVIGYLAWQKFGKPSSAPPSGSPSSSSRPPPVQQYQLPVDMGVTNPSSGWEDDPNVGLQNIIDWGF